MFSTTHDAILLVIAALYLVVGIVRTLQYSAYISKTGRAPGSSANLTVPVLISAVLVIVAVLW